MDNRPIGIFDSGLGGLTVIKEIKKVLPNESIIYLGDTARVPYGTRSKETIIKFSIEDAEFLLSKKVKCIIIACNTSSAIAFESLKRKIKIPVFDVITYAAKTAVDLNSNLKIGVIGTRATINSHAYQKKINKINNKIKVYEIATPLLVPLIEEGEIKGSFLEGLLKRYLKPFNIFNIDTIILGCTHYPIVCESISRTIGKKTVLINPGKELAVNLKQYLMQNDYLSGKSKAKYYYAVTDLTDRFKIVAENFLNGKIREIEKVDI